MDNYKNYFKVGNNTQTYFVVKLNGYSSAKLTDSIIYALQISYSCYWDRPRTSLNYFANAVTGLHCIKVVSWICIVLVAIFCIIYNRKSKKYNFLIYTIILQGYSMQESFLQSFALKTSGVKGETQR